MVHFGGDPKKTRLILRFAVCNDCLSHPSESVQAICAGTTSAEIIQYFLDI